MAVIYCFSSTGNSLYVAKEIAAKNEAQVVSMTKDVFVCAEAVVGFVFPVYFFGLPKTVEAFLERIIFMAKNPYVFMVATYGDSVFGVEGRVSQLLARKHITLSYAASIKMAENYLPMYPDSYNDCEDTFAPALDAVINAVHQKKCAPVAARWGFVNKLIYARYPARKKISCDSYFSVEDCIGCGKCAALCPRGNITIREKKPVFGGNCELCLGCLHICPARAINWKRVTQNKDRYRNPHIAKEELITFTGKGNN